MYRKLILLLLFCVSLSAIAGCRSTRDAEEPADRPTLILVSLDGFRWDYLERYEAPHLTALAASGVQAEGLVPVFPSKTFPNHYSIVTGLYPENHGIVGNNMYDPEFDASFSLGNEEAVTDGRWWSGEPIWVTAERQGLRAATYFWPGSEAEIGGVRPSYWEAYDGRIPGEARVQKVLEWLDMPPEERPGLITLYFSKVDGAGHRYGPESAEVAAAVQEVDDHIGQLVAGLQERGLYNDVHLLIVSDHGMAATSPERAIVLDKYIDTESARVISRSSILLLEPAPGEVDAAYEALHEAHPHMTVYRKEDIPDSLHFDDHRRIPSIMAIADPGWVITDSDMLEDHPEWLRGGTHGYLPSARLMHGLFIGHGPAFRAGYTAPQFENIHLYELMTALLNLDPAPNDGALEEVLTMLRPAARGSIAASSQHSSE